MLAEENIFVWSGHSYAVDLVEALGQRDGFVRVGPVHYNTLDEINEFIETLSWRLASAS